MCVTVTDGIFFSSSKRSMSDTGEPLLQEFTRGSSNNTINRQRRQFKHSYTASSFISGNTTKQFWPALHEDIDPNYERSVRRRVFLVFTKPSSSTAAMSFFITMMILVILANVLMMAETLYAFQFVPENCEVCDEFNATATSANDALFCDCEPEPHNYLISAENSLYYVFTVEYLLKIVFFSPTPVHAGGAPGSFLKKLLSFLFLDIWQLIDFVCLAPFYLSMLINLNSLTSEYNQFTFDYTSLRILRITRVFQVVKLGRNSQTFTMFIRVVKRSAPALKLLAMILAFGAIIFASLIYECERGVWEYTEITDPPSYQYMRFSKKSKEVKEISPFNSVPDAFWWFIVTCTTGERAKRASFEETRI